MAKKLLVLLLALSMLLLCGCGAVTEAEEAIAAIGTITPESLDVLEDVDLLLGELSARQRNRVENLQEFKDKKADCQRMWDLINAARGSIEAIGKVTPDSGDAIAAARKAYDALEADNLTDYASEQYPTLQKAEMEYEEMTTMLLYARACVDAIGNVSLDSKEAIEKAEAAVESLKAQNLHGFFADGIAKLDQIKNTFGEMEVAYLYESAVDSFIDGYYYTGQSYVDDLAEFYPNHSKTAIITGEVFNILLQHAETGLSSKQYKKADDALSFSEENYKAASFASSKYAELQAALDKELEKIRPTTGKIFHNSVGGGYGKLKMTGGIYYDSLVRLESVTNPDKYILFYVRTGETTTISVADGEYYIKYISGYTWYGEADKFGYPDAKEDKFDDTAVFTTTYSGSYVNYKEVTATLAY